MNLFQNFTVTWPSLPLLIPTSPIPIPPLYVVLYPPSSAPTTSQTLSSSMCFGASWVWEQLTWGKLESTNWTILRRFQLSVFRWHLYNPFYLPPTQKIQLWVIVHEKRGTDSKNVDFILFKISSPPPDQSRDADSISAFVFLIRAREHPQNRTLKFSHKFHPGR